MLEDVLLRHAVRQLQIAPKTHLRRDLLEELLGGRDADLGKHRLTIGGGR